MHGSHDNLSIWKWANVFRCIATAISYTMFRAKPFTVPSKKPSALLDVGSTPSSVKCLAISRPCNGSKSVRVRGHICRLFTADPSESFDIKDINCGNINIGNG